MWLWVEAPGTHSPPSSSYSSPLSLACSGISQPPQILSCSPLLRALSPSINPQERPPTQRGLSHLANQLLTQVSIPPTSAAHLLVCMTRPAGQHLSPASRYYLPALSPTYLPADPTHLPVGITHSPAGITHLPVSITHLLPGTTHLSTGTFVPVSHLLLLLFPSITHLLANFIPCGHHTSDS